MKIEHGEIRSILQEPSYAEMIKKLDGLLHDVDQQQWDADLRFYLLRELQWQCKARGYKQQHQGARSVLAELVGPSLFDVSVTVDDGYEESYTTPLAGAAWASVREMATPLALHIDDSTRSRAITTYLQEYFPTAPEGQLVATARHTLGAWGCDETEVVALMALRQHLMDYDPAQWATRELNPDLLLAAEVYTSAPAPGQPMMLHFDIGGADVKVSDLAEYIWAALAPPGYAGWTVSTDVWEHTYYCGLIPAHMPRSR